MRRQFLSWTSSLGRGSRLGNPGPSGSWGLYPPHRTQDVNPFRRGWIWTGLILILLLVGAMALLSLFETGTSTTLRQSTPIPTGNGEAPLVAPYDPNLGLAPDQPWGPLIIDLVIKLTLVLGLIIGVVWLLRKFRSRFGKLIGSPSSGRSFNVLDRAELGTGHIIYTVDLGHRILVVGATASEVTLLTEVDDLNEMTDLRRRSGGDDGRFGQLIAEAQSEESKPEGTGEVHFRGAKNRFENPGHKRDEAGQKPH